MVCFHFSCSPKSVRFAGSCLLFVWVVGFLLQPVLSKASEALVRAVQLQEGTSKYSLSSGMMYLEDKLGQYTIDEVRARGAAQWRPVGSGIPNFGFSDSIYWFQVDIENYNGQPYWYLVVDYSTIRKLDLYIIHDGQLGQVLQVGDQFEFGARLIEHRNFIFPVSISPGESIRVIAKIKSPYAIQFPAYLIESTLYLQEEIKINLVQGLFFGFVLLLAVHSFFIFLSIRKRSYLYYVFFSTFIGLFHVAQLGFGFQYLWPTNLWLQHNSLAVCMSLSLGFGALFVCEFLALQQMSRASAYLFRGIAVVAALLFVLSMFDYTSLLLQLSGYLAVFGCMVSVLIGAWSRRKGIAGAGYFTLGWFAFLVGVVSFTANRMGLIPRTFVTEYGMEISTVLVLVFSSLALAEQVNQERKLRSEQEDKNRESEKMALAAKERSLELERASNKRLERSMRSRTDELHKALAELTLVNHRMEELSMHDGVTGLRNVGAYEERVQHEWERGVRDKSPLSLVLVVIDGYDTIADRYGYVAAEECLKRVAQLIKTVVTRPADLVARIGPAEFGMVLPSTEEHGAMHIATALAEEIMREPINLGVCCIRVSVSVAVSTKIPSDDGNFMVFMEETEDALLDAIELGGGQIKKLA